MTQAQVRGPYTFTGGMNTSGSTFDVSDDQYTSSIDMEREYAHLINRNSYSAFASNAHPGGSTNRVLGYFNNGSVENIVAWNGAKVAKISTTPGGAWSDITGALTITGSFAGTAAMLNGIMVMTVQGSQPIQWNGTGNIATLAGSPPTNVFTCAMASNYMFLGGSAANPSRLYWSAVGDPGTWPGANFADFRLNDGYPIQAIIPFGEDLLIFKSYSMGRIYTNQSVSSLGPMVTISEKIGCAGPVCVDRLPDGRVVWLGMDNHAYIYDGNAIRDISDANPPKASIQPNFDALTFRALGFAQGGVRVYKKKNQVWFSDPFPSLTPQTQVWDYNLESWPATLNGPTIYGLMDYIDTSGGNGLEYFIAGSTVGNYYRMDDPAGGTTFSPSYTKSIAINVDGRDFIPRSIMIPFETTGTFSAVITWNYGTGGTQFTKTFTNNATATTRCIVPITWQSKASSVTVKIAPSSGSTAWKMFPYYLSDQVVI